jgi:hypothetical protein
MGECEPLVSARSEVEWITGNFDVFALAHRQLVDAEARRQGTS